MISEQFFFLDLPSSLSFKFEPSFPFSTPGSTTTVHAIRVSETFSTGYIDSSRYERKSTA
jgi:hypothetical protein